MFLNRVWQLTLVKCREQKEQTFLQSSLYLLVSCNSTHMCLCDYCVCTENGDFEVSKCTVNLEIFVVKIFSWFVQTTKIKNTKYISQWIKYSQYIFSRNFTAQLVSYFMQDGLFDTSMSLELMANTQQLFAQCPIKRLSLLPQYMPTGICTLLVRQQLNGSHERSMQAVRTLSVCSFLPDH